MGRRLGKAKLDKFRKQFILSKQKLMSAVARHNGEELDIDGDDVDVVQGAFLHSMHNKITERELNRIGKIDNAIKRIDDGTFGICEECEKQIPEKRLLAMPESVVCVSCAEEIETAIKSFVE